MAYLWDYDIKKLKKTTAGRRFILERQINYGVYLKDKVKLSLREVRGNWNKLQIDPARRRFLKLLIWGK